MNTSIENLTHKMQRAAVGKMVDVVLSHADKDRQKTMGQLVDVAKELDRISKELEKNRKFLSSLEAKLSNEKFVSRAPEAVVNAEKEKAQKTRDLIASLEQSEAALKSL